MIDKMYDLCNIKMSLCRDLGGFGCLIILYNGIVFRNKDRDKGKMRWRWEMVIFLGNLT